MRFFGPLLPLRGGDPSGYFILICPFHYFRFTFCKQYKRRKSIRVELVTILPIRSTIITTGKLDVYHLMNNESGISEYNSDSLCLVSYD